MSFSPPELSIGLLALDVPVVQAALSGYSDWPMRVVSRRAGAAFTICEVMLDQFLLDIKPRRRNRHLLKISDEEHPVGGQLMGADPAMFPAAAAKLVEAGFDVIDVNFGCPVKKVLGRCRGGFHLSQPDVALEIISRVREAVPERVPLTVKMRRGIDETAESRDKFYEIFDGAFARGVAAVTVHGRTVNQRYDGPSRWDFLRELKQHAPERTILGSGDLFTAQACVDMLRETGVDGVSVARGAIGNPWIFSQVQALLRGQPLPAPPSLFEQRELLREHFGLAMETYREDRCVTTLRKFCIKYARLHPQEEQVRMAFVTARNAEQWGEVLERHYAEDLPGRHPEYEHPAPILERELEDGSRVDRGAG